MPWLPLSVLDVMVAKVQPGLVWKVLQRPVKASRASSCQAPSCQASSCHPAASACSSSCTASPSLMSLPETSSCSFRLKLLRRRWCPGSSLFPVSPPVFISLFLLVTSVRLWRHGYGNGVALIKKKKGALQGFFICFKLFLLVALPVGALLDSALVLT